MTRPQNYPEGTPGAAVPEDQKHGHWGNNYPEHLNAAAFLGLPRQDRLNLALVSPGIIEKRICEQIQILFYLFFPASAQRITTLLRRRFDIVKT